MENLFDYIADRILETSLMEKALDRKGFGNRFEFYYDQIIAHWAVIILLPNNSARNHWKVELLSWLKPLDRQKVKGNQSKEKILKDTINRIELDDDMFYDIIEDKLDVENVEISNIKSKIKLKDFINFILDIKNYKINVEKL